MMFSLHRSRQEDSDLIDMSKDTPAIMDDRKNHKVQELQGQVNEVTHLLQENVEKVLERGDKIDTLQQRSEDLESGSIQFKKKSKDLRNKMCCHNAKMTIILIAVIAVILIVVIIIVLVTLKPWNSSSDTPHGGNFTSNYKQIYDSV
ncbi:hypothetical protein ScPMuIL_016485 [Solemya velum]